MPVVFARVTEVVAPVRGWRGVIAAIALGTALGAPPWPAGWAQAGAHRPPLPPFVLAQYGGGQVDLAACRGKVVLVNFWATWCMPCVAEFPALLALKDEWAGEPFEILAVNMGEEDDAIAGFLASLGRAVNFPVLMDWPAGGVAEIWPVRVLPTTIVVDKAGNLALKAAGERPWNSAQTRAALRPFLRE